MDAGIARQIHTGQVGGERLRSPSQTTISQIVTRNAQPKSKDESLPPRASFLLCPRAKIRAELPWKRVPQRCPRSRVVRLHDPKHRVCITTNPQQQANSRKKCSRSRLVY